MTEEVWRPVVGYNGDYEVSNHGRVRSWKKLGCKGGRLDEPRMRKLRPLRGGPDKHLGLLLSYNNQAKNMHVARLVLDAFVGPAPGYYACHNDGNPKNNRLDNLRWDTQAGNLADMRLHGTSLTGIKNPGSALTEDAVKEIRKREASGEIQARLSEEFGVSKATICRVVNRKLWTHLEDS